MNYHVPSGNKEALAGTDIWGTDRLGHGDIKITANTYLIFLLIMRENQ
ncbi:hypothetical protein [Psychrobacillus psychrodurans]